MAKISEKQKLDIASMEYFIVSNQTPIEITEQDRINMANTSATGKKPSVETTGYKALAIGRTYRDEQITSYMRDVRLGYFTKGELIDGMPEELRPWLAKKLRDVPYDEDAYELGYQCTQLGLVPVFEITGRGSRPYLMQAYRSTSNG